METLVKERDTSSLSGLLTPTAQKNELVPYKSDEVVRRYYEFRINSERELQSISASLESYALHRKRISTIKIGTDAKVKMQNLESQVADFSAIDSGDLKIVEITGQMVPAKNPSLFKRKEYGIGTIIEGTLEEFRIVEDYILTELDGDLINVKKCEKDAKLKDMFTAYKPNSSKLSLLANGIERKIFATAAILSPLVPVSLGCATYMTLNKVLGLPPEGSCLLGMFVGGASIPGLLYTLHKFSHHVHGSSIFD